MAEGADSSIKMPIALELFPTKIPCTHKRALCCCFVAKSCPTLLWSHGLQPARLLCPWDFPGKNTGMSCHFLLQGIFLTRDQTLISCIGKQILYLLSHQGSSKGSFRSLLMTLIFQDSSISPLTFSKWLTENFQISKLIAHSHFRFQSCSQRKLGLNPNHYTDYNDLGQATWPHWFSDLLSMKRR